MLELGNGRRVGCPAPFLPLPNRGRCTADSPSYRALRKARVIARLAQGMAESLALGASAVHRSSMPDLLVIVHESLVREEKILAID